jgi:hypothetical protein
VLGDVMELSIGLLRRLESNGMNMSSMCMMLHRCCTDVAPMVRRHGTNLDQQDHGYVEVEVEVEVEMEVEVEVEVKLG